MRLTLFIVFIIVSNSLSFSQSKKNIYRGVVKDANTFEVIPFATVAEYNDKTLINGVSTNEDGEFELESRKKSTHIEISFIGYQTVSLDITAIEQPQSVQINLEPIYDVLDEVVIASEKTTTQLKIDRKIINLGADLQQSGTSALEAFDQLPEIQTDLGTGSISLRGAGNVRILVNGKPSPLNTAELLEQIPSSYIDRIEIITSPSARNDANGLSGIINILLKKNIDQGFNLSLNSSVGTKRYLYGLDTNYNLSNINIRLNASDGQRNMDSEQWINQRYTNGNTRDFYAPHDFNGRVSRISSGLDFFLNDSQVLSFQIDHTHDFHSFYNNTFYSNVTNTPDFVYTRNSSHTHKTTDYNVNYRANFAKEGHFLEVDYNLTNNKNILPAEDFEESVFISREEQTNINNLHAFALDYQLPLNDFSVEGGLSGNYRALNSSRELELSGSSTTNDFFEYDEYIVGLYIQTKFTYRKWNWQTGLRYEYFNSKSINSVTNQELNLDFSNLFPTIHLSYVLNDHNTFASGYSKRISRPNFRNINPFQIGNQYFQWNANPGLKPEFSDNIELNYQYNQNKLKAFLSVFYRHRKDVIQWVDNIDENGVRNVSFENLGSRNSYGIESTMQYNMSNFWNAQLSANYYYTDANQPNVTWDNLYSSNIIFKNTFKLSKTISSDITYRYTPKNQSIFHFTAPRNRLDLAVRTKFLDNKLVVNLRIIDVFDQNLRDRTLVLSNITEKETWRFQSQTFGWLFGLTYRIFQNSEKTRNRKKRNYSHDGSTD
ncbi:TonB-dependent receptor family protein [Aquimarina sp. D1M17]|uniref:outer membrane beta-barrel family protein n=1 Tax=Aquimarina acroporae TaxID=2937283 RepID=UPI0020BF26ED|nr:outer membrane beta-barrel family protein [Aquimarina acroporae]MCK8520127.1 TonB-dependent receptor family protein [Aquimarina acroporae]